MTQRKQSKKSNAALEGRLDIALWGRPLGPFVGYPDNGPALTDAQLAEYERYAVQGLCEMLPQWYEEAGFSGVVASLIELIRQVDEKAQEHSEDDDERYSSQRYEAAKLIRLMTMVQRPEVRGALEFLAEQEELEAGK